MSDNLVTWNWQRKWCIIQELILGKISINPENSSQKVLLQSVDGKNVKFTNIQTNGPQRENTINSCLIGHLFGLLGFLSRAQIDIKLGEQKYFLFSQIYSL